MRCLVLACDFPSALEPWCNAENRRQAECLSELCELTVISPVPWPRLLRGRAWWRLTAGPDHVLDGAVIHHPVLWHLPLAGRGGTWRAVARAAERALARLGEPDFDVVFATFAYPYGRAAREVATRRGLPYVVKARGSDLHSLPPGGARRERTAEAVRDAAAVVALSTNLVRHAVELGADPERVHLLRNAVDADRFPIEPRAEARARLGLPAEAPILLFLGALRRVKGLDVLLDALRELRLAGQTPPGLQVLIAGDGPLERRLRRELRDPLLAGTVRLLGRVPWSEVPAYLNAADALVLPSRDEGCPNVVLEALACGTPVLASRVGDVPDLVGLEGGILVDREDPRQLAAGIREVLAERRDRAALRARVEPMTWADNARRLHDVLRRAVEEHPAAAEGVRA